LIRTFTFLLCGCAAGYAETYTLTLRQAVDLALRQNPELTVTRLDEQKAAQSVRLAKDPFFPRMFVASGAAYSSGYPLTIDGNPPSIAQAHAVQTFFNRIKTYEVAEARENERTTLIDIDIKRDDIIYRTASLYLDAERATEISEFVARQIQEFEKIHEVVSARVAEGKELEIEKDKAMLNVARAKQRAATLNLDRDYLERSLAIVLGYAPEDAVKISTRERGAPQLPASEEEAVELALSNSKELRRLESVLTAKGYTVKAQHASRLPQVDLVAEYALLTRYNFNQDFFRRFNQHAGQVGISIKIPVLSGTGSSALAQQAELDSTRLREQIKSARGRISLDARRSFQELRNVEGAEEVARLDLEVIRKTLDVTLAKLGEGRAALTDVATLHTIENEKWITFYDAQTSRERARLNVLRQTGSLLSALR
jgi:outer membrane protein TolC